MYIENIYNILYIYMSMNIIINGHDQLHQIFSAFPSQKLHCISHRAIAWRTPLCQSRTTGDGWQWPRPAVHCRHCPYSGFVFGGWPRQKHKSRNCFLKTLNFKIGCYISAQVSPMWWFWMACCFFWASNGAVPFSGSPPDLGEISWNQPLKKVSVPRPIMKTHQLQQAEQHFSTIDMVEKTEKNTHSSN